VRSPLEPVKRRGARIAVIIPVLDEEGAIGPLLAAIPCGWIEQVIVVDGGSRDRTVAEARAAGATVLVERERGYGRACGKGAAAAIENGAEILVFLDGDGGDRPEAIPNLVQPILEYEQDFVIGSRTRGKREPGSMHAQQVFAGYLAGFLIRALYGVRYTDMSPFRAIRRDALQMLGMREETYGWNLEMQMNAARSGLRILEIPVDHRCRMGGVSKVSGTFRGTFVASFRILATFLKIALLGT